MTDFEARLNELLVDTFRKILKFEEQAVKKSDGESLSISEFHLLEAISKKNNIPKSIKNIALDLGITLSSVTIAVNKLEKKGLLQKKKSGIDGRSVLVILTQMGIKENDVHNHFHKKLVQAVAAGISEREREVLLCGIVNLNNFFDEKA